jgi:fructose-1,6-bisphosphatase/inositol monophosphatase family enzyme
MNEFKDLVEAMIETACRADAVLNLVIPQIAKGVSYEGDIPQEIAEVLGEMELETKADRDSLLISIGSMDAIFADQGIKYNLVGEEKKNSDITDKLKDRLTAYDPEGKAEIDVIIDPLDSTNNGLHGFPNGYMIAVMEAKKGTSPAIPNAGLEERLVRPLASLVSIRNEGVIYVGDVAKRSAYKILLDREEGKFFYRDECSRKALRVSENIGIKGLSINLDDRGHYHKGRLAAIRKIWENGEVLIRVFGASGYQLPKIADAYESRGLGAAIEVLTKPHDVLPPGIIIALAGGEVRRWGPNVIGWETEQRRFFKYNKRTGFEFHPSYATMEGGLIAGNAEVVEKITALLEE